ncbi:MAG: proteasome accessory factor PafA2 family protein [Fimbriimonadales bacterium]|nr:proteasome accessory factor PafA2 family protein [Fimbriimonadales bacterium]
MRLFGTETEYGLSIEGRGAAEQIDDSAAFVESCPYPAFPGWDYGFESPRQDIRGFQVQELAYDPIDAEFDFGKTRTLDKNLHANRVLTNGARFYNDHGHPEYSTPECSHVADLLAHDLAGERIVLETAMSYEQVTGKRTRIYKNNTDFHGASYGTHENYLFPRDISSDELIRALLPFLITRMILFGAGKVGSESGRACRYQVSQRADFYHETANIETLYRRPIFNTRDEPHADPNKWRRVHVICGDANRMPWSIAMKVATTQLALDLIKVGEAPQFVICNPPRAAEALSKDETFTWRIELEGSSWTTAIDVLDAYLSAAEKLFTKRDAETDWSLAEWRLALTDAANDPRRLSDRVDWAAKLVMLEEFSQAEGEWNIARMQSLDLEYHNIDPSESLFNAWIDMGRGQIIIPFERVTEAMSAPPQDTRAKQRGDLVAQMRDQIESIGWRRAKLKGGGEYEFIIEH